MTIYRFVDKNNETLYVGKTTIPLRDRLNSHCTTSSSCPIECYRETKKIFYFNADNDVDLCLYEIYFINIFKPKYNKQDKYLSDNTTIVFPEVHWTEFEYNFNQEKIIRYKSSSERIKKVSTFLKKDIKKASK